MRFRDRAQAGEQLGQFVARFVHGPSLVMGIPLGGVAVAEAVAKALGAPLDVVLACDIHAPPPDGLLIGGLALGAPPVLDRALLRRVGASHRVVDEAVEFARDALSAQLPRLRGDRPLPDMAARTVVIVDEGLETGYRALAAARMLHEHGARKIIIAAPVSSQAADDRLGLDYEVAYLEAPEDFASTANHYESFAPVSEAEVVAMLERGRVQNGEIAEIDGWAPPPSG